MSTKTMTVCDDLLESNIIPSADMLEACGWVSDPDAEERTALRRLAGLRDGGRCPVRAINGDVFHHVEGRRAFR